MTTVDRSRSAVLVMDFQASILGMLGDAAAPLLDRAAAVVSAARAASLPVMYVVILLGIATSGVILSTVRHADAD
jgi:nicotinamidase-related amidase